MAADWLQRQALVSAERLLDIDPWLLSSVGRELLPVAEDIVARARRAEFQIVEG